MRYKGYTHVAGELKPRICYGAEYKTVADWASRTIESAPEGTVIQIWEIREVMIQSYIVKAKPTEAPAIPPQD